MSFDSAIVNGHPLLPGREPTPATIAIRDGRIAAILAPGEHVDAGEVIDARGLFVLPGLIDPHMHIGFAGQPLSDVGSETRSAAVGGVTSILNYVLKPGSYDEPVREFVDHIERLATVDMGMHLGIFSADQIAELPRYVNEFGVSSFKFFMSYKGEEGPRRGVLSADDGLLFELLTALSRMPGTVANVHAENVEMVWRAEARVRAQGLEGLAAHHASRPGVAEGAAVAVATYLQRATGSQLYIVHLSSKEGVREVERARAQSRGLFIETAPHYLSLTEDSACGLLAKVNPPVRAQADVDAIWDAVARGLIDTVGNDHSARLRAEKGGGVWGAGAAFPGVATMLPVLLTEGLHRRGVPLRRIVEVASSNTARIFNLYPRKGVLAVGADADIAIVDLDLERVVNADFLASRADFSPWEGQTLRGWPVRTIVRGTSVMIDGEVVGSPGYGRYLRRPPAAAPA